MRHIDDGTAQAIATIRAFNRFYTRVIGALTEHHLDSQYSLPEARLLFELAKRDAPTAATLVREMGVDPGYLSRLIARMIRRRLVTRSRSKSDAREQHLSLTATGRNAFATLDARASEAVAALIEPISAPERARLLGAMNQVASILGDGTPSRAIVIREPRPGDMGWVIQRHGELYFSEYGWDQRFEALVARIVANFVEQIDPALERCWIAERGGVNAGSVFLVRHPTRTGVAQLRLLLVEPSARGAGLGQQLVSECIRFARAAGYHTMMLWTNDILVSARRIYIAAGFVLTSEEHHDSYGKPLTAQTWELRLR
jgi:DNA-binding MarR family transcriptional regulator/GNAT superfamily N-acetyltransferase